MQWNAHAFLSGPEGIANLFNTNIFYPYPLTLAYSEHFLMPTGLALPFLLITDSHMFGMNLSVLITFILSGYGMYLLISTWTGQRWAGLVAGVLFAFSPHRFGQLNHLELLVTQWMPFTLLALHWTLTRRGRRYAFLFALFFNLQALSGFHYALNLTLACALLTVVYAITRRIAWRGGLWLAAGASIVATLLLNWPIWRMYLRFSDVMGAVRTPGEVRIYSAALTDYLTAIPYNFLYGWTFGRWQFEGHQFQPLMPVGVVGLLLALLGLSSLFIFRKHISTTTNSTDDGRRTTDNKQRTTDNRQPTTDNQPPTTLFFLILTLLALLLSFGLNENALGETLAPLLSFSPYRWLYENVAIFQGIRVPGRYGILVVLGLTGLAGWGVHLLFAQKTTPISQSPHPSTSLRTGLPISQSPISNLPIYQSLITTALIALILLEYWSAPLTGPEFPSGQEIPPVYHWLRQETPPETVLLELPFEENSEFLYEYYSSYHWRRLANGGTGFTPPIYEALRQWFNRFPDPRAVDVIQQMGIDRVILHPDRYTPEAWQRVLADLPRYLPAIEKIDQVGPDMVLTLAEPACSPNPDAVHVSFAPAALDGLDNAVAVTYQNSGVAAFVADVERVSHLTFDEGAVKNFTEPLVTPAGASQAVIVPLAEGQSPADLSGAWLATVERTVAVDATPPGSSLAEPVEPQQPLGLQFAGGPQLVAYGLGPEQPTTCGYLDVALAWQGGQRGDVALVQLLDPFGRLVVEDRAQPWSKNTQDSLDRRRLPLVGPLPPGRYGLRVRVGAAGGQERSPITAEGVAIPADQIPPLPVVVHPRPVPSFEGDNPLALFNDAIRLVAADLTQASLSPGGWLRFRLVWQAEQPLDTDLTVFTQLLGPAGQVWGQRDNQPRGGWYVTSLWPAGQPVVDDYAFPIQPDAPPGDYRLIAGLYQTDSQERLTTQTGADFVEIGRIQICRTSC